MTDELTTTTPKEFKVLTGSYIDLEDRGVTEKTCRMYGYQVAKINGKEVHIANYYQSGELLGQHLRGPNKQFAWRGSALNICWPQLAIGPVPPRIWPLGSPAMLCCPPCGLRHGRAIPLNGAATR